MKHNQARRLIAIVFPVILFIFLPLNTARGTDDLADLFLTKTVVDLPTGDDTWTSPGSVLQYTIKYGNCGNFTAENAVITEPIPEGTYYIVGSAEENLPPDTVIEYSNDQGSNWDYVPGGVVDPAVSDFRIRFLAGIPAPATFWAQDGAAKWSTNTCSNVEVDGDRVRLVNLGYEGYTEFNAFSDQDIRRSMRAFDANGDGYTDIACGNSGALNELYFNDGAGNFTGVQTFNREGGTNQTWALWAFDADGDEDLDVAVGNNWPANQLYINDGGGNFTGHTEFNDFGYKSSWSMAPFDADGDNDIDLACGQMGQPNELYINDGSGTFTGFTEFCSFGNHTTGFIFAFDADGDEDIDIAVANVNQPNELYINDGAGNFTGVTAFNDFGNRGSYVLYAFDADGDNDMDLLVSNGRQPDEIYFNDGAGNFTGVEEFNDFGNGMTACWEVFDADNDGDLDVVLGHYRDFQPNEIYYNDGSGNFSGVQEFSDNGWFWTEHLAVLDVNRDGYMEVAVGNGGEARPNPNELYWWLGFAEEGTVTSPPINPTALYHDSGALLGWGYLVASGSVTRGADITYDVLDHEGAFIMEGMGADKAGRISLAGIDPVSYPEIMVRANLRHTHGQKEIATFLDWWIVTFRMELALNFTFQVEVQDPIPPVRTGIENSAVISTTTPETDYDNNSVETLINIIAGIPTPTPSVPPLLTSTPPPSIPPTAKPTPTPEPSATPTRPSTGTTMETEPPMSISSGAVPACGRSGE